MNNRLTKYCNTYNDSGEDTKISRETMKVILTQRGTHPLDDYEAEQFLNEIDVDQDGNIDVDGRTF